MVPARAPPDSSWIASDPAMSQIRVQTSVRTGHRRLRVGSVTPPCRPLKFSCPHLNALTAHALQALAAQLPQHVHQPGSVVGQITQAAAERAGLAGDCVVCAGTTGKPPQPALLPPFTHRLQVANPLSCTMALLAMCSSMQLCSKIIASGNSWSFASPLVSANPRPENPGACHPDCVRNMCEGPHHPEMPLCQRRLGGRLHSSRSACIRAGCDQPGVFPGCEAAKRYPGG